MIIIVLPLIFHQNTGAELPLSLSFFLLQSWRRDQASIPAWSQPGGKCLHWMCALACFILNSFVAVNMCRCSENKLVYKLPRRILWCFRTTDGWRFKYKIWSFNAPVWILYCYCKLRKMKDWSGTVSFTPAKYFFMNVAQVVFSASWEYFYERKNKEENNFPPPLI